MILALEHFMLKKMRDAFGHHQGLLLILKAEGAIKRSEADTDRSIRRGKLLRKNVNGKAAFVNDLVVLLAQEFVFYSQKITHSLPPLLRPARLARSIRYPP